MVIILISNLLLQKPIIDSVLFSLAIAVGITPQLLPAVVSTGLATGSRQLAKAKVLVKRLVCIEDLGDIDILITDKTGTLTEGRIRLVDTVDPAGAHSDSVRRLGLLATDVDPETGGASANSLDAALWESPQAHQLVAGAARRVAMLPFDHERRATSALVDDDGNRVLVVKGAPEQVLAQCRDRRAGDGGDPCGVVRRRAPGGGRGRQTGAGADDAHPGGRMRSVARGIPGLRRRTQIRCTAIAIRTGRPGHRAEDRHRGQSAGRRKGMRRTGFGVEGHHHRRTARPAGRRCVRPTSRRTTPSSRASPPSRRRG